MQIAYVMSSDDHRADRQLRIDRATNRRALKTQPSVSAGCRKP